MLRGILFFCLLSLATFSFAQNGSISGIVTDATTGETVVGANVVIQGTAVGSATDIDGKFNIPNVKPGNYSLTITFITYKPHNIPDILVESGKVSTIQVQMHEDVSELKEVVITGTREINNDVSLISAIKESKLVVSGISAQQIAKLPDNDAAQVMKRVPGITIVDSRFVMVRGVPERYNQVMINNAIAPSTEIDRRSFSFDLIPAGALDQLLIYKSGSADLPGDFAGGVIQMFTKQASEEEFTSVGISLGYRANTTFSDFGQSNKGSTEFLGFDNGYHNLPSDFPSKEALRSTGPVTAVRSQAGLALSNDFEYNTRKAPFDYGFNFGIGRNFNIGKVEARNLTTLNYSTSFQSYQADFNRYNAYRTEPNATPVYQFKYKDNTSSEESKINLVHNWIFNFGQNNKIEFKNLFVQIGENQTVQRNGENLVERPGQDLRGYSYRYLARSIYSGQLQTTLKSADEANTYTILFAGNYIKRNEPDYRRFRQYRIQESEDPFETILPPSSSPTDAGRFYSSLEDLGLSHAFNFERKLGDPTSKRTATIKAGYYAEQKTRDFSARYITYVYPGFFDAQRGQELARLPLNQLFSQESMFTPERNGFSVQEGSRPTDEYRGESLYTSGYVSGSVPLGKFDLSGGFRLEHNIQKLTTKDGDGADVEVKNPVTSPLPFVNLAFNISDRSLVRTAYSRTVNRPEFRELAPFTYYQFELDANASGNPDLETATIDNIDLRWEMYPNKGEVVSLGGFYKKFKNPIEVVLVNTGGLGQNFSYQNAPEAYSFGAELELRKSLASLSVHKFFHNTTVNLNASWIRSQVDFKGVEGSEFQQSQKRVMQGQSPYVINAGIFYSDVESGFSANVGYNIFGKRITAVGSVVLPTWWELPRQSLDVQLAKEFGNFEIKLNVSNLLNAKYRIYQDDNSDDKIDKSIDELMRGYQLGQHITLGVNWKLSKD